MKNIQPFLICNIGILMLTFTAVFSKLIEWPTLVTVSSRSVIAMLCLALFLIYNKQPLMIKKRQIPRAWITGILLGMHWYTYFKAVELSSIAIGLTALFTFPIITTLIEPYWFKTRLSIQNLISAGICFLGICILLYGAQGDLNVLMGIGMGICSAIVYSLRNLISKQLLTHIPSPQLMFHQTMIASVFFIIILFFSGISVKTITFSKENIVYALLLGSLFTGVAHTCFMHGFKYFKASFVSILAAVQPFYGTLLGMLIIKETPSMSTWIGGGITLLAIFYATFYQAKIRPN